MHLANLSLAPCITIIQSLLYSTNVKSFCLALMIYYSVVFKYRFLAIIIDPLFHISDIKEITFFCFDIHHNRYTREDGEKSEILLMRLKKRERHTERDDQEKKNSEERERKFINDVVIKFQANYVLIYILIGPPNSNGLAYLASRLSSDHAPFTIAFKRP